MERITEFRIDIVEGRNNSINKQITVEPFRSLSQIRFMKK